MGSNRDGGYAEVMTARATGLVSIPDQLSSEAVLVTPSTAG
jgi:alcohol dehydrogenase